jgi:hypothetical protein
MKKIVFLITVVFLTTGYAQAFDFHGVKSGMTKEQVEQAMTAIGAKNARYPDNKWEEFKTIDFPPLTVLTEYDHAGKLMELQLGYATNKLSSPAISALKSALETTFKATIHELENVLAVIVTDETILKNDFDHYKAKFNKEL